MPDIIQQRRDTAARWKQYNPVLLEGEIGYVTDNPNQYKIGNGVSKWNDLPLRGYTGTITQELGNDENAVVSQKVVSEKLSELGSEINGLVFNGNTGAINGNFQFYETFEVKANVKYAISIVSSSVMEGTTTFEIRNSSNTAIFSRGANLSQQHDVDVEFDQDYSKCYFFLYTRSASDSIHVRFLAYDNIKNDIKNIENTLETFSSEIEEKNDSILSMSEIIMPSTNAENLIAKDSVVLNLEKARKGIFVKESIKSGWAMSRLIEIEPLTQYTIGLVSVIYEWDSSFNIIKTHTANSSGFVLYQFITSESAKFVSIQTWVDSNGDITSTQSLQKGSHSELLPSVVLNVSDYKGVAAEFKINNEGRALINRNNIELYRGEAVEYEHITEGYFINKNLSLSSQYCWNIYYYPVKENEYYLVKGETHGVNVACVCLVEDIDIVGNNGKLLVLAGNDINEMLRVEEAFYVPKGIKYVAISTSNLRMNVYPKDKDSKAKSRIDKLEENVSNSLISTWKGKRLLAIGDSITAQKYWQQEVGNVLGMNIRTHAKGGIGIIQMVDGDGSGDAPEGYDPDSFGTSTIYRLNESDVADVAVIILMGFYNTRSLVKTNRGELSDMYPTQNTWYGQMNYAIKRVYEELEKAGNYNCKVVVCSAHNYGKYPYVNESAYDDGQILLEATKTIANRHSLPLIDLMNNGNINMYNWGKFQSSSTSYATNYIPSDGINDGTNKPFASLDTAPSASDNANKYITVSDVSGCYRSDGTTWVKMSSPLYPWNGDQLHLNQEGGYKLGEYIARQLLVI